MCFVYSSTNRALPHPSAVQRPTFDDADDKIESLAALLVADVMDPTAITRFLQSVFVPASSFPLLPSGWI